MKKFYLVRDVENNKFEHSHGANGVNCCRITSNYKPRNAAYRVKIDDVFIFFDKDKNVMLTFSEGDFGMHDEFCLLYFDRIDSETPLRYFDKNKHKLIKVDADEVELQGIRR